MINHLLFYVRGIDPLNKKQIYLKSHLFNICDFLTFILGPNIIRIFSARLFLFARFHFIEHENIGFLFFFKKLQTTLLLHDFVTVKKMSLAFVPASQRGKTPPNQATIQKVVKLIMWIA